MQINSVSSDPKTYSFPVMLEPAFDKRGREVTKTRLVVRQDTADVLASVSNRYRLITHEEIMQPVNDFTEKLGKATVTYSVEKNGAKLVATHTFKDVSVSLPGHNIPGLKRVGDVVSLRTHSINSYNGSTSFEFKLGAMVLRCLNGATVFDDLFNLSFRHLGGVKELLFPDPEVILMAFNKQGSVWKQWADTEISRPTLKLLVDDGRKLQLVSGKVYKENESYFTGAETVWDAYNAFTAAITRSARVRESGKLNRFDRLNALFNHTFNKKAAA